MLKPIKTKKPSIKNKDKPTAIKKPNNKYRVDNIDTTLKIVGDTDFKLGKYKKVIPLNDIDRVSIGDLCTFVIEEDEKGVAITVETRQVTLDDYAQVE